MNNIAKFIVGSVVGAATLVSVHAQTTAAFASGGYHDPAPMFAAPGQVVTIFMSGIPTRLAHATNIPLPTTLAGISVSLRQHYPPNPGPIPVPLFAISGAGYCTGLETVPCAPFIAITLQIPVELIPNQPLSGVPPLSAELDVSVNGSVVGSVPLGPVPSQVHVLKAGDTIVPTSGGGLFSAIVTHADGSVVYGDNPARSGEVLVMYAVGLGLTTPVVPTGHASPNPAATTDVPFKLDFPANASPSAPAIGLDPQDAKRFVGLTPGSVGLFQINFAVPPVPAGTPPCGGLVRSNFTISIGDADSFDGAAICVAVASK